MDYKLIVSDRDFVVLEDLTAKAGALRWDYNRIGGCGKFSFNIPIDYCTETSLGGNFNVKIYRRNPTTNAYDLWYQGRIENKIHNVRGRDEIITIRGSGYQSELADIYIDRDYSNIEISAVVKDILDNDVVPNTNITYSASDIVSTGFTADTLKFNTTALNAMRTLADIVGSREWGVDKNRQFFFKARSTVTGFHYPFGSKIFNLSIDNSSKEIVNRVIVTGGDVAGSPFVRIVDDAQSQLKWKRRDKVVQNSAITTNAVADQFAQAIFAENSDIVQMARCTIIDEILIEENIPIPLFEIITREIAYDEEYYDTFLYAGQEPFQISRVSYRLDNLSNLIIDLQLGQLRPGVAESISQIEYKLDQLRSQGV